MQLMRRAIFRATCITTAVFVLTAEVAVTRQAPSPNLPRDAYGETLYKNAKPYIQDSLRGLKRAVPQLHGLNFAPDPSRLPEILDKVSARVLVLAQRIPNLLARETVIQTVRTPNSPGLASDMVEDRHEYGFLILRTVHNGSLSFDERLTDLNGRPAHLGGLSQGLAVAQGFTLMWTYFYPSNLGQSNFRYVGKEKLHRGNTLVVVFAQKPVLTESSGVAVIGGQRIRLLYQGVAWIDRSTYQIVRMRTDLLAPRPDVDLRRLTSVVKFGNVTIPDVPAPLWLPLANTVTAQLGLLLSENVSQYRHYRLFRVQHRILY
jgi:hypothetical protein